MGETGRERPSSAAPLGADPPAIPPHLADHYRWSKSRYVGLAFVVLGNRSLAEDAVQEAFLAVATKVDAVDNLDAYLRQAVVNRCRAMLRRQATARRYQPDPAPAQAPSYLAELRDVLLALPEDQRTVIVLRYLEGMSDVEIAEVIGCRRSTVRSHAARALKRLRKELL
jgi:RNA polymerase sigma factor (sigma-70 family)